MKLNTNAQEFTNAYLDSRDGNNYRTIQIGQTTWFQDNLKYETEKSYYPNTTKKKSKVENGNFYSYKEAHEVCPQGWNLPSENDWSEYFSYILDNHVGTKVAIKIDTLHEEFVSLVYRDTSQTADIFADTNPLALSDYNWVQGRKIRPEGTMSYWIDHTEIEDKRFHVHLRKRNYTMHRHKHHLNDKKSKQRKFMVRCVKSK